MKKTFYAAAAMTCLLGATLALVLYGNSREIATQFELKQGLPEKMELGRRYPVVLSVKTGWKDQPHPDQWMMESPMIAVGHRSEKQAMGLGSWNHLVTLDVMTLTPGPYAGELTVPLGPEKMVKFELGTGEAHGILGNDPDYEPKRSTYTPEAYAGSSRPWWVAGALSGAVLVLFMVWRQRRSVSGETVDHAARLEKTLEALRKSDAEDDTFHEFLSNAVGEYLTVRWDLPVSRMTSQECLAGLEANATLPHLVRESIREYLIVSDLARYSRDGNADSMKQKHLAAAETLLMHSEAETQEVIHG